MSETQPAFNLVITGLELEELSRALHNRLAALSRSLARNDPAPGSDLRQNIGHSQAVTAALGRRVDILRGVRTGLLDPAPAGQDRPQPRHLTIPHIAEEISARQAAHAAGIYPPEYIAGNLEVLYWLLGYDWHAAQQQAVWAMAEARGGEK